jgi:hypothetical protein
MQTPSVNRQVHYVSYGTPGGEYPKACRVATVTEVGEDGRVGLCVMNPTGRLFFHSLAAGGCLQDEDGQAGGTWHWPERV